MATRSFRLAIVFVSLSGLSVASGEEGRGHRPVDLVDSFLGNGATRLPPAQGVAATWWWRKAETGNTDPGPRFPFGMVTAVPYSGGYSSGYGLNHPSYRGQPRALFDDYTATGFSHFQHSGTGFIRNFYNYFKVTPFVGTARPVDGRWVLERERASPGYYGAELKGTGIRAELTVTSRAALHRYTFPTSDEEASIAIDLSAGGIPVEAREQTWEVIPTEAEARIVSNTSAEGRVVLAGLPFFFSIETNTEAGEAALWKGARTLTGQEELEWRAVRDEEFDPVDGDNLWGIRTIEGESFEPFGLVFRGPTPPGGSVLVKLGFSLRSVAQARANASQIRSWDFDGVAAQTEETWNDYLGRIRVAGGTKPQRQMFYTALYHSLIKPADFTRENPFSDDDSPFFFDFATLWDTYKTQCPLMTSVYPEHGRPLVEALLGIAERRGEFPIGYVMQAEPLGFTNQASALAHAVIADAYVKGIDGVDWNRAKKLMAETILRGRGRSFATTGAARPEGTSTSLYSTGQGGRAPITLHTHTMDYAYASFCTAQIAGGLGDEGLADQMMELSGRWRNALDPATGRLPEGNYYEGGNWTYSFRLLHDMAARIGLYESDEAFVKDLDVLFGYREPPPGVETQPWEGLNNQADMEVPYAYLYAGRPDRTAEIVRATMRYRFSTGRGGLPGNDDSGGTSAWFVWSAVGLFPVTGQDVFLIGSPLFESATIRLGDESFTVQARDNSDQNIYVQGATLNGDPIDRPYVRFGEMAAGGVLVLQMGPEPSGWGREARPPSHPPR